MNYTRASTGEIEDPDDEKTLGTSRAQAASLAASSCAMESRLERESSHRWATEEGFERSLARDAEAFERRRWHGARVA